MEAFETMDLQHKKSPLLHDIRSHLPRRMYIAALAWRWLVVLLTVRMDGGLGFKIQV